MGKEQLFSESDILLSTTDLDSHIKYANKNFFDIAGSSFDEMVGKPHNMVRHSDMPKAAFKDLWHHIRDGKSWMVPVKNRCKNGDYYWVNAFVTPIKDAQGKTVEYQSVRTCPKRDVVDRAENLYGKLNRGETPRVINQQMDMTLICQVLFSLILIFSMASPFVGTSLWLAVPMILASFAGTVFLGFWRSSSPKDETSQIATAISEMSSTIQEIAQVVAESSTAAQQGLDISSSSQSIVSETIDAIRQLLA